MRLSSLVPAVGRRAVVTSVAILLCAVSASSVRAQQAAAQTPAQPAAQAQPQDTLKLDLDVPTLLIFIVKPDRVADFESFWPDVRAALAKKAGADPAKADPDLKAFSDTLVPYKVKGVPGVYVFKLDPPSKKFSYNPVSLLYYHELERADADTIYKKWDPATVVQIWPLEKVGG